MRCNSNFKDQNKANETSKSKVKKKIQTLKMYKVITPHLLLLTKNETFIISF